MIIIASGISNVDLTGNHPLSHVSRVVEASTTECRHELTDTISVKEVFDVLIDFLKSKCVEDCRRNDDRGVRLNENNRLCSKLLWTNRIITLDEAEIDQSVDVIVCGRFREIKIVHDLWWRHWSPVTDVDVDASESWLVEELHECFETRCILGEELRLERLLVQDVSRWRMEGRGAPSGRGGVSG